MPQHTPVHPFTGLAAIGFRRNGAPIWPVVGGSEGATEGSEGGEQKGAEGQGREGEGGQKPEIDWKAKSREWERKAKANADAAKRLAEIESANKSEAEKAAERLAEAEKRAVDAEARVLRREIALEHKLSKDDAALLDALTDEDAMRSLAARLAKDGGKKSNYVPREGTTSTKTNTSGTADEREFVRDLFGSGG